MPLYDMENGMYFKCQRCTHCCRWPGEVVLTDAEVNRIAAFLELSVYDFVARYTDLRENRTGLTLRENQDEGTVCIFLDGKDCRINPVKPDQCAGFPNQWNFKGWREKCEAIPVPIDQ